MITALIQKNFSSGTPSIIRLASTTLAALLLMVTLIAPADLRAQANYFQGKTIRVVVGSSSGGGYDLWARLMAQHIGKHIPGNPTVVVQNMPGAGGVVAANYVYGIAKPDGLTLGAFNPALYFDQLVGRPEVKFDWSKFTWVGSPEQNQVLHYIRTDAPFKTIDDLRNAKEPPRCGSTGTGTTGHYFPRLLEETLGIKTIIVGGYQGGSEIDLAVERNEVVCWSPLVATYFGRDPYKRWHKSGFTRVVVQTGAKRDERIKDVPTLNELMAHRRKFSATGRARNTFSASNRRCTKLPDIRQRNCASIGVF